MRRPLAALLCVLITTACLGFANPGVAVASDGGAEASFVAQINNVRASKGIAPLAVHGELVGIGRGWSDQMAAAGSISHNGGLTSQVSANWTKLGENVGVGYNVDELMNAFVASPAHYKNIVDPAYNYVGVGVTIGADGRMFVTQDFMAVGADAPAPQADAPAPRARAAAPARAPVAPAEVAEPEPVPVPVPPPSATPSRVAAVLAALRVMST
jgi:hypothetical protein